MTIVSTIFYVGSIACFVVLLAFLISWYSNIIVGNYFKAKIAYSLMLFRKKDKEEKEDDKR